MSQTTSPSLRKLSTMLIGATIGAGIFGVPYAFAHTPGRLPVAALLVAWGVTLLTNRLLARVVVHSTSEHKDLIGLYQAHFPTRARHLTSSITLLSFFTSLLVYSRLGPDFLNLITGDLLPEQTATAIYIGMISTFLRKKLEGVSRAEQYIVSILITLFVVSIGIAFHARPAGQNIFSILTTSISGTSRQDWLLPYGVLLYALSGMNAVPLLCIVAAHPAKISSPQTVSDKKIARSILIAGVLCIAIVGGFGLSISGALGSSTTQDALHGMKEIVWPRFLRIGGLIWLLAVTSCNVLIGMHTRKSLYQDYKIPRSRARGAVVFLPVITGIILQASFIQIISFAGGVLTASTGLRVARLVRRVLWQKKHLLFRYAAALLGVIYISGIVLTIIKHL